jgi:hypothetical protein
MAKPVIVFYIYVGNLDERDVAIYVETVKESTIYLENDYHRIVIPTREGETKVEMLSPNIITLNDKVIQKLKQSSKKLIFETEQLLDRMPFLSKQILLIEKNYSI